jgi:hypothetical protein
MKRILLIVILVLAVGQYAMGDGVVMATSADLKAFDSLVKMDRQTKEGSLKKEAVPERLGQVVKDEAAKLKFEGSKAREAQQGKWVVEQRKSGRTSNDAASDAKTAAQVRENGPSNGKGKKP